jgi:phage tail sheath protein FI
VFDDGPTSTQFVIDASGSLNPQDEIHVVVYDADGGITGKKDTVLEVFGNVSLASDAVDEKGESNYIGDVLRYKSNYIYYGKSGLDGITKTGDLANTFGTAATFTGDLPTVYRLANGAGTAAQNNADAARQLGYDLLADADTYDVSLLIMGESTTTLAKYVHDNIASVRKDCVVFFSPTLAAVNGGATDSAKATAVTADRDLVNINSSYAVMDSGWKRMYDKYNDKYRDVPLNGDVAGTCVATDNTRDPWYSPAGFDRGQIKNVVKLHFNPQKAHRDTLYKKGVNPVVNFPGSGIVLFGDKTQLTKPSAFDRINVRRLFIVLEKAISRASKFSLFEFNDEFTRAQFRNMVEPFLRDVKARRGVYDYRVICDDSNNTAEVIDRNEFIGDIFIKPARSINFIQLNFVAVRTGVDFSEVVGAV